MDPVFKFPASPGTPLHPISPERANRQPQHHHSTIPSSPSLPSDLNDQAYQHNRTTSCSDVQGKVAQFNNLSKEALQRRRDNEAALRRAVLGREEAEGETRRAKEEGRASRREIEEGRERERRVGERLEGVMVGFLIDDAYALNGNGLTCEELHRAKETQANLQASYAKDMRKARKEAFKSSSALVKLQEELKSIRNVLSVTRSDLDLQRVKVGKREQEAFAAQYQLVGVQEELQKTRQQVKVVEEERDTLKTSLKEEEVARIAAEGRIALPVSKVQDEFSSPKKRISPRRQQFRISMKENMDPKEDLDEEHELKALKEELMREKRRREEANDQIEFMKMECQLGCCSCRVAEWQGLEYVHNAELSKAMQDQEAERVLSFKDVHEAEAEPEVLDSGSSPSDSEHGSDVQDHSPPGQQSKTDDSPASEPPVRFSPTTGTFQTVKSEANAQYELPFKRNDPSSTVTDTRPVLEQSVSAPIPEALPLRSHPNPTPELASLPPTSRQLPLPPSREVSTTSTFPPRPPHLRIISTTTTIPLALADATADIFSPSTMSREEALEQIRQRRGRARSFAAGNLTPRKQMVEGGVRRDISAPAIGGGKGKGGL
ncbi:MAG: hypothetical protein M1830_001495 [Pleopsidium flavum]|nr:MAG: hypothetical protein M1830_001495 [Pleopsidium flavum]